MTTKEAFKAGFLLRCAEAGLTESEAERLAERGLCKQSVGPVAAGLGLGALAHGAGTTLRAGATALPHVTGLGLLAGLGLPVGAGLAGGFGLAKMTEPDRSVEDAQTDELLQEYHRLTEQARRQHALRLQGIHPGGLA